MKVSERILSAKAYQPGKPIEDVKRELGLRRVFKLASNENPYPPSPKVLKAIEQEARHINRYPDGNCFVLRQKLARQLKVAPGQLIFGNGSDEIIIMAIRAFVEPGDEVIIARPTFLIYEIASKIAGANVRAVPLKDLSYDLAGMMQAVTDKTKIVFIGNPDNPAGTYITQAQLRGFLDHVSKDILVFLDEAYFDFVNDKDYPDAVSLLKTYQNLFVARTFSKVYGLAGLRIGYGIGDLSLINIVERLREPFNVNSLAQAAALACLEDRAYYRRLVKEINRQKNMLYHQLDLMGVRFYRSATNFILIDVSQDGSFVTRALLKKGVIVRDMTAWGFNNLIRVTIGLPKENEIFLKALRTVLMRK